MKKMNTFLIAFSLAGIFTASMSYATFEGGSGVSFGSLADYAKKAIENTFTESQQVVKTDSTTVQIREGFNVEHNERASYCMTSSDGSTKTYCMTSANSLLYLEGQTSAIFGTNTGAGAAMAYDVINNRVWLAPFGSVVVASANTNVPDTTFMVGSNVRTGATFLVDATNDWIKLLPIAAPAATECDDAAEKGRIYYDSGTDKIRFCNGTAWTDL